MRVALGTSVEPGRPAEVIPVVNSEFKEAPYASSSIMITINIAYLYLGTEIQLDSTKAAKHVTDRRQKGYNASLL
jgi:hypothetical protein